MFGPFLMPAVPSGSAVYAGPDGQAFQVEEITVTADAPCGCEALRPWAPALVILAVIGFLALMGARGAKVL